MTGILEILIAVVTVGGVVYQIVRFIGVTVWGIKNWIKGE